VRRILSRFPTSTLMGLAFTIPAMLIAGLLLFYHSMGAREFLADEGVRYGDMLADQLLSASQRFMRLGSPAAVQEVIEETGSKRSVVYVALIGKDGRVIARGQSPVDPVVLSPGKETEFRVTVAHGHELERYRLSFVHNGQVLPHVDRRSDLARTAMATD